MGLGISRMAHAVTFNTGISNAEYNEKPVGQTLGGTQKPILPGSTTVSEAIESVFPSNITVWSQILTEMAKSGSSTSLRTAAGYHTAAEQTILELKEKGTPKATAAAQELETLLDDGELLAGYQAALLES